MSAQVLDQLVTKQAELSGIVATLANEGRAATDEEKGKLAALKGDIDAIKSGWEASGRRAFLNSIQTVNERKLVLKSSDKFADVFKGGYDPEFEKASISKYLRGYLTGEWNGAPLELKTMASSAAGAILPTPIGARVIDLARAQAVVFRAGAQTVPMTTATLKLARMTGDVTADWFAEGTAIDESDATLDSVTFTARKMGVLVRINNELLEDSAPGVDSIIENSIAKAMALELDRVALIGSGTPPEPQGILNQSGINELTSISTLADYDDFLDAIFAVRADNHEPNAVVMGVDIAKVLAKLKTGLSGDKTPLVMPADYAALQRFVSTQIPPVTSPLTDDMAFVGDFRQLMIGLRSNISIEMSREADDAFSKDQIFVRATWRGDVQLAHAAAFCAMTGISA